MMAGMRTRAVWAPSVLAALLVAGCQGPVALTNETAYPSLGSRSLAPSAAVGTPSVTPTGVAAASPARKGAAQPDASPSGIQLVAAHGLPGPGEPPTPAESGPQAALGSPSAAPPTVVPPGLSLPAAIETGLAQNPDLVTLRENEGVAQGVLGVAQTYPFNPTFQTRILPWGRNPDGTPTATFYYFLLWQTFELAQQQRFREQSATAALENTRWTIQQAALQNVALTEQLYFTALYQRGLRDLARRASRLSDEVLAVTERRQRAGRASLADLAMARIDARAARQQAQLAENTFLTALLALRRQLNLPSDAPLDLQGDLTEYTWQPASAAELCKLTGPSSVFAEGSPLEVVAAQLAGGRPDVVAARANYEVAGANLRLARAARVPNLMIGPFYEHDTFATISYGLQAQLDIPVVNTGKPLVRQREAELRQRLTAWQQLQNKATVEARTALERYEQARRMTEQARTESGQQLPGELAKLEDEFRKGEIDILRISQARTSLLLLRRTLLDSLNELAQAAAAVTAAAGLPPAALVVPPGMPAGAGAPCAAETEPEHPVITVPSKPVY